MSNEDLEIIIRVLTTAVLTSTVLGLGIKYALLPWLKTNLVDPVKQTNNQVSQNNHVSIPPTMLDTLHEVDEKVDSLTAQLNAVVVELARQGSQTSVIAKMWDHHLDWSTEETKRIWRALNHRQIKKDDNDSDSK